MKKYILSISLILLSFFGISSVYAISATGWTVSGQNTYFDGTGNVGLGNNSPASKLDITGMQNLKSINDYGAQFVLQPSNGTSQKYGMGTGTGNILYFGRTSGTAQGLSQDIVIKGNGFVGINNADPQAHIDVLGAVQTRSVTDGAATLAIYPQNYSGQRFGFTNLNSGRLFFGKSTGSFGGVEHDIVIDNNGYVGIYNQYPTERFDVNGNIKLNGNIKSAGNDICIGNC